MKRNKYKKVNLDGEVLIHQPRLYTQYIIAICIIVFVSSAFMVFGTYDKKVRVTGSITTSKGITKIIASESGIIRKQFFGGGDSVSQKGVLYNISKKRSSSEKEDVNADLLANLSQAKLLQSEKYQDHQKLAYITASYYASKLSEKESELTHLLNEVSLTEQQIEISKANLAKFEQLKEAEYVDQTQYNERLTAHIRQEIEKEKIMYRVAATRSELVDLKNKILAHPITTRIEGYETQQSLSQLEQQVIEVSARRDYSIVSPTDGFVATNLTKQGEAVLAGQTLMTILPNDFEVVAELYVPSGSIGFVQEGQPVSMRYSAFPFEHYGLYGGTISEVSQVISEADELNAKNLTTAMYKVTVKLTSQTVTVKGQEQPLQVGMELDATIILETRSLLQWMMAPIYSLRDQI